MSKDNAPSIAQVSAESLLSERGQSHGSFYQNAHLSQAFKNIAKTHGNYDGMDFVAREAFEMICLKLSRILSGKSGYCDHWDDIAGYATLVSEHIREDDY